METRPIKNRLLHSLIRFANSETGAAHFIRGFSKLWREHRDSQWKIKEGWGEPFDEHLQAALLRGEISQEEFSKRWDDLWGVRSEGDREFLDMIDRVHSACDVFRARPESESELDEGQLRSFVAGALAAYWGVIAGRERVSTR